MLQKWWLEKQRNPGNRPWRLCTLGEEQRREKQAGSRAVTSEDGTYRIYHGEFLLKQMEVKGGYP